MMNMACIVCPIIQCIHLEEIFHKSRNFLTVIPDIVQPFCKYEKFLPFVDTHDLKMRNDYN